MNSQENIIPKDAKTVYIKNIGTVIIPKRNTEKDILEIAEALKDDLETLKELFCVVKLCDYDIKSEIVEGVPVLKSSNSTMDTDNQKALNILETEGQEKFIQHEFTDQENERKLSYSEMISRYG